MGFSRQEYWRGCHSLLQGNLPDPGSNLCLLHCRQFLYHWSKRDVPPSLFLTASQSALKSFLPFFFFLSFMVGWERNKSEIIYSLLSLSRDSDNFRAEKSLFSHSCKEFLQIQHILTPMYSKKRIQEKYSGQDA